MTGSAALTDDYARQTDDEAAVAVGIDIGGTNLRAARVTADGRVLAHTSAPTPSPRGDGQTNGGAALVDAILDVRSALGDPVLPLGIGIAATVDRQGRLTATPNLDAEDVPLGDLLRRAVDQPLRIANDAVAAVWAEHRVGAARGVDDVILVTIGTGVGGGAVIAGNLVEGAHGMATEFGHLVIHEGGRLCPCGVFGCLEAYASGRAFGEIAAERLAEGRGSPALAAGGRVDGVAVTRAAVAGDPLAIEVLVEAGRMLGVGLASLVNALDPELILVGGGAGAAAGTWLLPAAREAMASRVMGHRHRRLPEVRMAALGDEAGVVGAALLAAS